MKPIVLLASLGLVLCLALFAAPIAPGSAAPRAQLTTFPTPTPGADGKIFYTVQPLDTLWRISAITGVSVEKLRELNNLGADQAIVEGQRLLIGFAGPVEATPTAGASVATPAPAQITPSLQPGWGIICVILYADANGDSMRQDDEIFLAGGAISVSNRSGSVSRTADTAGGLEPQCFSELPENEYNITVAIPAGYNATTVLNRALELKPGETSYLAFGAQRNSEEQVVVVDPTSPEEVVAESETGAGEEQSPWLGFAGVLLLLSGIGLGVYAAFLWRARR